MMAKNPLTFRVGKETYRTAISLLYSFFLSLFLLLSVICCIAWSAVFSDNYFLGVLNNGYYDIVSQNIITSAEDFTIPAEFDISVIDGVFDKHQIKNDIDNYATAALNGKTYSPDCSSFNPRLIENVEKCIESGSVELDGNSDKDKIINAYVDDIDKIYSNKINITGIKLFTKIRAGYRKWFVMGIAATVSLSLFMIFFIILLNRKKIDRALSFISYSFGGATLMSFAAPFILYRSEFYRGIRIPDEAIYNFVSNYLRNILLSFIGYSLFGLSATLLLIAAAIISGKPEYFSLLKKNGTDFLGGIRKIFPANK